MSDYDLFFPRVLSVHGRVWTFYESVRRDESSCIVFLGEMCNFDIRKFPLTVEILPHPTIQWCSILRFRTNSRMCLCSFSKSCPGQDFLFGVTWSLSVLSLVCSEMLTFTVSFPLPSTHVVIKSRVYLFDQLGTSKVQESRQLIIAGYLEMWEETFTCSCNQCSLRGTFLLSPREPYWVSSWVSSIFINSVHVNYLDIYKRIYVYDSFRQTLSPLRKEVNSVVVSDVENFREDYLRQLIKVMTSMFKWCRPLPFSSMRIMFVIILYN